MFYFSVDGSPVVARRQVVSIDSCNDCHGTLSLHGENRNQIEQCVLCHNASETDVSRRPKDQAPSQTVEFAYMIHRLHAGENGQTEYTIYGFGGSKNDFSEVGYPDQTYTCTKCHVNNGQQIDGKTDVLKAVTTPRQYTNPTPGLSAACGACHTGKTAWSHFLANTTQLGESCETCHGTGGQFSVDKVHAQ